MSGAERNAERNLEKDSVRGGEKNIQFRNKVKLLIALGESELVSKT